MRTALTRTFVLLGVIAALGACENKDTKTAKAMMSKAAPHAAWDEALIEKADITCDGKPDIFAVADSADGVWIGMVEEFQLGLDVKPVTVRFPYGNADQGAICTKPKRIERSERVCDTEDGKLPGCQPIKGCQSVRLVDDECDSFNFYWDNDRNSLTWWRR